MWEGFQGNGIEKIPHSHAGRGEAKGIGSGVPVAPKVVFEFSEGLGALPRNTPVAKDIVCGMPRNVCEK